MNTLSTLLAAALVATAGAASASTASDTPGDRFSFRQEQDAASAVRFGSIVADPGSVIEVYDYHLGQMGRLLASKSLGDGHNIDVRVNLGMPRSRDVLAVLKVDGEIVGQQVIRRADY